MPCCDPAWTMVSEACSTYPLPIWISHGCSSPDRYQQVLCSQSPMPQIKHSGFRPKADATLIQGV
jgi:hypothetical protein